MKSKRKNSCASSANVAALLPKFPASSCSAPTAAVASSPPFSLFPSSSSPQEEEAEGAPAAADDDDGEDEAEAEAEGSEGAEVSGSGCCLLRLGDCGRSGKRWTGTGRRETCRSSGIAKEERRVPLYVQTQKLKEQEEEQDESEKKSRNEQRQKKRKKRKEEKTTKAQEQH